MTVRPSQVEKWMTRYVDAWRSYDRVEIEALYTPTAEVHELPDQLHWIGHEAIVAGWGDREQFNEGGWSFDWTLMMTCGDTAAIRAIGVYSRWGVFENLWTLTFAESGECSMQRIWSQQV